MLQTAGQLLLELPLFIMIAVATHLVMSFAQTLMHYKLGHHPIGGKFFRNHINFHHTYYSKDHLLSRTYLSDEGNNTPFFFIPVLLVGACTYFLLPVDLFVVQVVACAASFYAHVFFDKEYHVEGSRLQRFAWFRRKQELHFVHHRHANCNFAVIHFFWDRIFGTYRRPDAAGQTKANGYVGCVESESPRNASNGRRRRLGQHLLVEDQCSLLSVLLRRSIRSARARKCAASFMHASLTSLSELWRATKRQSSASSR
jgi:sterol desaturase/sphingolipid hydroxylase (fatty acid hydroxylase superfamily)